MSVSFFVETRESAQAIQQLDQNVMLSDGRKLSLRTKSAPPPQLDINDAALEKIKVWNVNCDLKIICEVCVSLTRSS